jgi:hypothetical protein
LDVEIHLMECRQGALFTYIGPLGYLRYLTIDDSRHSMLIVPIQPHDVTDCYAALPDPPFTTSSPPAKQPSHEPLSLSHAFTSPDDLLSLPKVQKQQHVHQNPRLLWHTTHLLRILQPCHSLSPLACFLTPSQPAGTVPRTNMYASARTGTSLCGSSCSSTRSRDRTTAGTMSRSAPGSARVRQTPATGTGSSIAVPWTRRGQDRVIDRVQTHQHEARVVVFDRPLSSLLHPARRSWVGVSLMHVLAGPASARPLCENLSVDGGGVLQIRGVGLVHAG